MSADSPSLRLLYVADPMCSWCWGFAPVLEELRTTFDLPVDVVLGGLRPGPAARPLDPGMISYLRTTWGRIAEMTGQPFDFTALERQDWVYDTELPSRAVVAVRTLDPASALPFFRRLQRAFYAEAIDVTAPAVYGDLVAPFGIDPGAFGGMLESDEIRAATWKDFEAARAMGITGFPALLGIRGHRGWVVTLGYQPAPRLHDRLRAMEAEIAQEGRA